MDAVFALEFDVAFIAGLVGLGFAAGVLSGLFGVGGGFLLTPMLNVLFGIPYHLAVGSGLVQMALMTWVGTVMHIKNKNVDFKLAMSMIAGSFLGAEAGVRLQGALKGIGHFEWNGGLVSGFDLAMALIFIVLLNVIGWGMVAEGRASRRRAFAAGAAGLSEGRDEAAAAQDAERLEPRESAVSRFLSGVSLRPVLTYSSNPVRRFSFWVPAGIGFAVSVLTGLLGTGGGFINLPVLIYGLGMPTAVAVGTASVQTMVASIYSGARHLLLGNVVWLLVFSLLAGSLPGVRLGVRLSTHVPKDRLRASFGYVAVATALIVIADIYRSLA